MDLTEEQRVIIEDTLNNKDGVYFIKAAAGSGKSFTIFKAIDHIKKHKPFAKILYIVFNKANQVEAENKLSKYSAWLNPVKVSTAHSYARELLFSVRRGSTVIQRLDNNIIFQNQIKSRAKHVKESKHAPFIWLLEKYETSKQILDTFCEFMEYHFDDFYDGNNKPKDCTILDKHNKEVELYGIKIDNYSAVTKEHIEVFKNIIKEHEKKRLYTHGMYLKAAAYCKNLPKNEYDYVFFDEAQDASYFMLKVLEKQDIKKLYFVGDERQSIYNFNGVNENVFTTITPDKVYTLSKSFRFGEAIANLANEIISLDGGLKLSGTEQDSNIDLRKCTRLYRTNSKMFKDSLELAYLAYTTKTKIRLEYMNSKSDESIEQEILYFLYLYYKYAKRSIYYKYKSIFDSIQPSPKLNQFEKELEVKNNFFKVYNEFYDFLSDDIKYIFKYAKESEDFIEKYLAYNRCKVEVNPSCTILMTTMHKSKGMEWDNVVLAEELKFFYKDDNGVIRKSQNVLQELNLAYVAVTRARKSLNAEIIMHDLCMIHDKFMDISFIINNGVAVKQEHLIEEASQEDEELIDEASSAIQNKYLVKQ